jgi:NitT/TauT family transport system substrate-binding protein
MKKVFLFILGIMLLGTSWLNAETKELRISKQYGLAYLPLIVLEEQKIIEKNAKAAGLGDIKVEWVTFGGGSTANEALLSGNVDLISGGVAPFVRLWDKSKGNVKALASLDQSPLIFNTSNPNIKSLKDFSDKDKIAVPAVKVSIQSLVLQMAVAKELGIENFEKLDGLTVSFKHPDALIALTSGKSEITGHIANEPFASTELQNKNIHTVFNSYDVFGGNHTTNVISTTKAFYEKNPELAKVILASLDEVDAWISNNKQEAAKLYLDATKSKESLELITSIISDPQIVYGTTPFKITTFSDFLFKTGAIKTKPENWKELYFDLLHVRSGS